jgi:hypothetical protein
MHLRHTTHTGQASAWADSAAPYDAVLCTMVMAIAATSTTTTRGQPLVNSLYTIYNLCHHTGTPPCKCSHIHTDACHTTVGLTAERLS